MPPRNGRSGCPGRSEHVERRRQRRNSQLSCGGGRRCARRCKKRSAYRGAQEERKHDEREPGSDLVDLFGDDAALRASAKVRVDAGLLTVGERMSRVLPQALDRPTAVFRRTVLRDVGLQPRATQPLTRAIGQRGNTVRADTEDRCDLVRIHPLDLGVPEHGLPAVGQASKRPNCQRAVQGDRGRVIGEPLVFECVDVVDVNVPVAPAPAAREVPDGRVQVGTKPGLRATPIQDRLVNAGVSLRDQVIGVEGRRELPRHPKSRTRVTLPQLGEGRPIACARKQNQRLVGERWRLVTLPPHPAPMSSRDPPTPGQLDMVQVLL